MKILSIKVLEHNNLMKIGNSKLLPVSIIQKNFWGIHSELIAYPTNYGPTYGKGEILFFYFCDKLGKELPDQMCKQINNFLKIKQVTGEI